MTEDELKELKRKLHKGYRCLDSIKVIQEAIDFLEKEDGKEEPDYRFSFYGHKGPITTLPLSSAEGKAMMKTLLYVEKDHYCRKFKDL